MEFSHHELPDNPTWLALNGLSCSNRHQHRDKGLSEIIAESLGQLPEKDNAYAVRKGLIKAGDDMRKRYGNGVLAELAIREIAHWREVHGSLSDPDDEDPGCASYQPLRVCHIIDSIKNEGELEVFRLVYGSMFHAIGVFATEEDRARLLQASIKERSKVEDLIETDALEKTDTGYGQSVRKTFPRCDYFISARDTRAEFTEKLQRLLELIFGVGVNTPTAEERTMHQAAAAAVNSGCLSRQVGAALHNVSLSSVRATYRSRGYHYRLLH
jgi:hypothetical protein